MSCPLIIGHELCDNEVDPIMEKKDGETIKLTVGQRRQRSESVGAKSCVCRDALGKLMYLPGAGLPGQLCDHKSP